jgi:hypothetical protein
VQVDPIKPNLKPPGNERLKLKCDILLSTCALKFNLSRYTMVDAEGKDKNPEGKAQYRLTVCFT